MEGDDDELEDLDCMLTPPRRLFEGGVYFTQRLQLCGVYSRAASIRGRRLFAEIRYVPTAVLVY